MSRSRRPWPRRRRQIGATVVDYSVGPVFSAAQGERGRHLYIVEFAEPVPAPPRIGEFAAALDAALCATNEDYAAHRAGGYGLDTPSVTVLQPGGFTAWMKGRGRLGGQNKVPRIINDEALTANLRAFAEAHKAF